MNIKIKIFLAIIGIFSLTSCNDWLEVTPKGQVEASDLLETPQGYYSALGGVYYNMIQKDLFGENLSYGFIDALAQYWDIKSNRHYLHPTKSFDYKNPYLQGKVNTIWSEFYKSIAQCNHILESLGESDSKNLENYNIIKGEALGLRAFMHIQLLRLYGPVVTTEADMEKNAINYRTKFNPVVKNFDSYKKVLNMAKTDLQESLELLKDDPIKVNGRRGNGNLSALNYQDVLDRRGSRFNYFAALAMLARTEQLLLNKEGAFTYAKQLIDEVKTTFINSYEIFRFIDKDNITTTQDVFRDIKFSSEMIFSLYNIQLDKYAGQIFAYKDFDLNQKLYLKSDFESLKNYLYGHTPDGSGDDYRLNYWFAMTENYSSNWYRFMKFKPARDFGGTSLAYYPEMSIIRLPDIYYIACESQIGKNNTLALEYLNDVRVTRGLQKLEGNYSDEELMEFLIREQRKEYFGEGRMFYLYKRLNIDMDVAQGVNIEASASNFVWPIPEDEYEFSLNEKPE